MTARGLDRIRWRALVPVVLLALLAGAAGCARAGTPAAADPPPAGIAAGSTTHSLTVAGRDRTFRLYRPADLPADRPVPLVVMLHGGLGSGAQAEAAYGWDAKADSAGFVVAYPDGLNRSWAVSPTCCGRSAADGVDDVAFITELVSTVSGRLPIDANRVYATGISNGGMLAYRLACDTTVFAAIGPDSATLSGDCPGPAPISVLHIHGTADSSIPYAGGPGKRDNGGVGRIPLGIDGPPIEALLAAWRETAGCPAPDTWTAGAVTTTTAACPQGRAVTLIAIAGAGHQWPGAATTGAGRGRRLDRDQPATAVDATGVFWAFFAAHPRTG